MSIKDDEGEWLLDQVRSAAADLIKSDRVQVEVLRLRALVLYERDGLPGELFDQFIERKSAEFMQHMNEQAIPLVIEFEPWRYR
jgi:hypothetical protein